MSNKRYLGDGVYVDYDGINYILTTEDGISVTNRIVLEPLVYLALITYANTLSRDPRFHKEEAGEKEP